MIKPTEGKCFVMVFYAETGIKNVRQSLKKSPGFATANFHLKKLEKNPRNQLKNIDTHGRIVKIWAEISMPGSSSEMNT